MAYASFHISSLLDKMNSHDKDYRFMATNDLMMELQKDSIKLDDDSERKVIKMLLKLLEDKNGEVQNLAVRCLGPLVSKVKEHQVETIVDTLCSNMISEKEQLRDISSIGLKTVISEFPQTDTSMLSNICKKITNRLTAAISKQEDVSVQLEALDILGDLLSRHGSLLTVFHVSIKDALLPLLKSNRMAVRKRANTAIGHLAVSCNSTIFTELVGHLVNELQLTNGDHDSISRLRRTYVQCICAITRQAGHKVGKFLNQLMPLVTSFCQQEEHNYAHALKHKKMQIIKGLCEILTDTSIQTRLFTEKIKVDDELREHCIHTFELFVRRCPMEVTNYLATVIDSCLTYLTYDPNYNYDDGDAYDDFDEDEDDDDYSDDDDMSWKVRRASAKCLEAIVSSRPELMIDFYQSVSLPIIARFKEREESVRTDIFNVFISLVKHTRTVAISIPVNSVYQNNNEQAMETEDSPLSLLTNQVPDIVNALQKHLKEKSIKTRHCCFVLLSQLTTTMPGCLSSHLSMVVPGIEFSLASNRSNSSNMKIDTLGFVHILLTNHPPDVLQPYVQSLAPLLIDCVKDPFYKITSDALLALQDLVKVICSGSSTDHDELIRTLYSATLNRLKTADIDQEVKERAITCMGQIMSSAGDRLVAEVPATLELFLDRLKNEITRLTTVKSLHGIAQSQRIALSSILPRAMPVLANFLRKNQRSLKISTLRCLDSIFSNYASDVTIDMMSTVVEEIPQLINESDLHIAQLALQLLTLMFQLPTSASTKGMLGDILPNIYNIVKSPLLHGGALNAVLEFFRVLVTSNDGKKVRSENSVSFRDVLRALIEPIYPQRPSAKQRGSTPSSSPLHKQAFHSTAKCIAALVVSCPSECDLIVRQFMMDVENQKSTDSIRTFALLALGEIGQNIDLSAFQQLEMIVLGAFNAPNEEVKSAASFSLGRFSIGNLQHYLPGVIKQIQHQPKSQYLLLHSLKETISFSSSDSLDPFMEDIWSLLMEYAESHEEGTRNVVAECLGKLTLIHPERFLNKLQGYLSSNSTLIRSTVVTAIKFTITDQPLPIDPLLKEQFGKFLTLLQDEDLNVKRATLTMLNSAAHNKATLIRDLLPEVLPKLYNETKVRKELIREVMMGPFRHTVDDGLDVRKAAFECMYTLLEASVTQLDIFEFLTYVENGLKDSYDIKMLTSLMLVRLAHLCPTAVLQHVDRVVEPLRTTCTVKVKADSVKQEFEKQNELKRSALRVVHALLAIPEADKSPTMSEFLAQIRSSPDLSAMFDSVQKDPTVSAAPTASSEAMDTS